MNSELCLNTFLESSLSEMLLAGDSVTHSFSSLESLRKQSHPNGFCPVSEPLNCPDDFSLNIYYI